MQQLYIPDTTDTKGLRQKIFHVIFGYQQRASIVFDVMLVLAILLSVAVLLTSSVGEVHHNTTVSSCLKWNGALPCCLRSSTWCAYGWLNTVYAMREAFMA